MLATNVLTLQQSQATLPGSTIMAHSMSTFQPVTAPMVMTHFQAPPTQGPLDSNRPISPKLPRYIEVPRESAPDQGKQQQSAPDQGNKQQNKPSSIWRLPWKTPAADRSAQNGNTQPLPTFLPPSRSPSPPPLPPSPPSLPSLPPSLPLLTDYLVTLPPQGTRFLGVVSEPQNGPAGGSGGDVLPQAHAQGYRDAPQTSPQVDPNYMLKDFAWQYERPQSPRMPNFERPQSPRAPNFTILPGGTKLNYFSSQVSCNIGMTLN
jgi:hypothetical protein